MVANNGGPRVKALSGALRRARKASGCTVREVGGRMGVSHSVLSYWETGKRVPRIEDVATYLAALGVTGDDRKRILDLARNAGESDWLTVGIPGASQQLSGVMECELTATQIVDWAPLVIPGLLQTSSYARAILGAGSAPRNEVEAKVTLRVGRRDALTRSNPAALTAIVGEFALRQQIGGRATMVDQLRFLLKAAESEMATIKVLPGLGDWHPGLMGPFILFEFPHELPIVHLEHHRSGVFLYDEDDVAAYQTVADGLRHDAMSPEDSVALISEIAETTETMR